MLSSNHLRPTAPDSKKLCIWIFHDSRPGHLSQLEGLVNRLAAHHECHAYWLDISNNALDLTHIFRMPEFSTQLTQPDIILGAGHKTHLSVLIAGFKFKAFTALIMKPSLPICLFDAIICPKHDNLKDSKKILSTLGSINKIDKNKAVYTYDQRDINLILIGGISKHYLFDADQIIEQIKNICLENPGVFWELSNSPRTPDNMNQKLSALRLSNLEFHHYENPSLGPLEDTLLKTRFTWITPDSMSMIFEALTAGSKVGLLHCEPNKSSRIVKQVTSLIDEGYVSEYGNNKDILTRPSEEFPWEADRAAIWLLERYLATQQVDKH